MAASLVGDGVVRLTDAMTWDNGTPYVEQLAPGMYAYVQPDGGWMVNNCGVVVDGGGIGGAGRHDVDREAEPRGAGRGREGEHRRRRRPS